MAKTFAIGQRSRIAFSHPRTTTTRTTSAILLLPGSQANNRVLSVVNFRSDSRQKQSAIVIHVYRIHTYALQVILVATEQFWHFLLRSFCSTRDIMACHYCDQLIRKLRGKIAKCKISNCYFWVSLENFDSFVTGVTLDRCASIYQDFLEN